MLTYYITHCAHTATLQEAQLLIQDRASQSCIENCARESVQLYKGWSPKPSVRHPNTEFKPGVSCMSTATVTQLPRHRSPENTHHNSRRSLRAQHATVCIPSAMGSARRTRAVLRVPRVPNLLSPTRRPCQATAMQPPRMWDSRWEPPPRCNGGRNRRHRPCSNHGASSPPRSMRAGGCRLFVLCAVHETRPRAHRLGPLQGIPGGMFDPFQIKHGASHELPSDTYRRASLFCRRCHLQLPQ